MSIRYQLVLAPEFFEDLTAIRDYIAGELESPAAARRQVARIRDAAQSLKSMPMRHPLSDRASLAAMGVRLIATGGYVVLYRVDEKERCVTIARVLYGRRDLDATVGENHT